jgi:hypothetical protein
MGINARIETERAERIAEIIDPGHYVSWILGLRDLKATLCLRFIDPYGDTVFNPGQLPELLSELESMKPALTKGGLELAKQEYLNHAAAWPEAAVNDAQHHISLLSINDLRRHLEALISLVENAIERGPHHYVKFIGD